MAFQNTAGTIILDAVLTDVGRKRMVEGKFDVSKFLLGDDEIDYGLYDSSTGGVQTNIENTPILEAFANEHADINHGLLNFPSDDIIYMPYLAINSKASIDESVKHHQLGTGSYFLAANAETAKKIKARLGRTVFNLESGTPDRNKLFIESGITATSASPIPRNQHARENYIMNLNLLDKYYIVSCDGRFFDRVLASGNKCYFYNDAANNLYSNFEPLSEIVNISLPPVMDKYLSFVAVGTSNKIYENGTGADNNFSVHNGPRGTIVALNFKLVDELTGDSTSAVDSKYSTFGQLDQYVLGGGNKFDVIETSIHIEGASTSSKITVPIKILRYSGT